MVDNNDDYPTMNNPVDDITTDRIADDIIEIGDVDKCRSLAKKIIKEILNSELPVGCNFYQFLDSVTQALHFDSESIINNYRKEQNKYGESDKKGIGIGD